MKDIKFSWEKIPLSSLQCKILHFLLKEGYPLTQGRISKKTKSTISGVQKALKDMVKLGLIAEFKQDLMSYIINPYRKSEIKKFILGWDLGKNKRFLVISGHAFVFEAEINDLPSKLIKKLEKDKSFVSYRPSGWKCAFNKALIDGSFTLRKTKKKAKLICYFRTFGFNASIIEQINNEKFWDLKRELESHYSGLKIGSIECIAKCPWQEYSLLKDPIAILGVSLGIKHKKIEQSYDYPEWEEKGFNAREKIEKIISLREKEVAILEEDRPL